MTLDIKDFFLCSERPELKFMKIPWKLIPEDIRQKYQLYSKVHKGYIYMRINKGMYGLKQAVTIASHQLVDHLSTHGYSIIPGTSCMFQHSSRPTKFCLCMDDFGIKYFNEEDAEHLQSVIFAKYKGTVDKSGKNYCRLTFDWNYEQGYMDISMTGHVEASLKRLQHNAKMYPQYSAHKCVSKFSKDPKKQQTVMTDTSPLLLPKETTYSIGCRHIPILWTCHRPTYFACP